MGQLLIGRLSSEHLFIEIQLLILVSFALFCKTTAGAHKRLRDRPPAPVENDRVIFRSIQPLPAAFRIALLSTYILKKFQKQLDRMIRMGLKITKLEWFRDENEYQRRSDRSVKGKRA